MPLYIRNLEQWTNLEAFTVRPGLPKRATRQIVTNLVSNHQWNLIRKPQAACGLEIAQGVNIVFSIDRCNSDFRSN